MSGLGTICQCEPSQCSISGPAPLLPTAQMSCADRAETPFSSLPTLFGIAGIGLTRHFGEHACGKRAKPDGS
jgi:hypothetical protein